MYQYFLKSTVLSFLFLFLITTVSFSQDKAVNSRNYRNKDGKWYTFFSGKLGDEIIPNRLIVRHASKTDMRAFDFGAYDIFGVSVRNRPLLKDYYVIEVSEHVDPFQVAQLLDETVLFEYIGFDAYGQLAGIPDDTYYAPDQWNLKSGKLNMEKAWNITKGEKSIVAAIIDDGTFFGHEDLIDNIWQNLGEDDDGDGKTIEFSGGQYVLDPGDLNGSDSDGNGYVDDLIGWDTFYDDNLPDAASHGTLVAGIVAAKSNNAKGISGIAGGWGNEVGVKLMILKDVHQTNPVPKTAMVDAIRTMALML